VAAVLAAPKALVRAYEKALCRLVSTGRNRVK
jgi:hypothetical protein